MKLTDLIFENTGSLRSYMNFTGDRLGPQNPGNPDGSTVREVQTQLKRHQLQIANQAPNAQRIAWIGPIDGVWNQALSDAIIEWKKSINLQDENARLNTANAELSPKALRYLVQTQLYDSGSVKGLIYKSAGGSAEPREYGKFVWSGRTFDVGHQINTATNSIKNTKDFLLAIGESGWIAILDDFIKTKGVNFFSGDAETRSNAKELVTLMKAVEAGQMRHPVQWLGIWEGDVLKRDGLQLKATLASGNEMHYSPRQAPGYREFGSVEQGAQQLYEYFKALATGILRKYKAEFDANQPEVDPETGEETIPTMSNQKQRAWVNSMQQALYQGWYEYIPMISDPNDEKTVRQLMQEVRSAGEYDVLTAKYNELFGTDMNEDLAKELDDETYANYVARPLRLLNRIRPIMLHTAIPFGESESVSVTVDGVNYKIYKERKDGSQIQVFQRRRLIKNVILQDEILKAAIEKQGGSIPDIIAKPSEEFLQPAAETTIAAVQSEAAFMVPFYVGSEPFDEMTDPTMGIKRLKGLQEQAARMLQSGMQEEAVFQFVKAESIEDGKWLISTESVHWDAQWKNVNNNVIGQLDGILDEIDPSDEQVDLVNRLHKQDTRNEAMQEILAEVPVDIFYEEIYRIFKTTHGTHFDEYVLNNKTAEIIENVENGTAFEDTALNLIVEEIGLAKAAPAMLAKTFEESLKATWWRLFDNDEDLAFALVLQIEYPEDYALVNEWYKKNGNSNSLIDDLDGSEWAIVGEGAAVEQLKQKLGIRTSLARANFDPQLENVMQKALEDTNLDNLDDILKIMDRNRTGLFATIGDDSKPESLDQQQIATFFTELTNMSENILKESDEAEKLFEILDKMIAIVEETFEEVSDNTPNQMALQLAQRSRSLAEENWFN